MYEYLDGRIAFRGATRLVIEVGGVGYDVAVPVGATFDARPPGDSPNAAPDAAGARVRIWTHFVVRENAQLLFGFPNPGMRELFRLLLQVRGVGPHLAQAILSSLPERELLAAIAAGDAAALRRIKGVGKKTAEQILLDLKDRAPSGPDEVLPGGATGRPSGGQLLADAVAALVSIGYTEKQAEASVGKAAQKTGSQVLEDLVRAALRE